LCECRGKESKTIPERLQKWMALIDRCELWLKHHLPFQADIGMFGKVLKENEEVILLHPARSISTSNTSNWSIPYKVDVVYLLHGKTIVGGIEFPTMVCTMVIPVLSIFHMSFPVTIWSVSQGRFGIPNNVFNKLRGLQLLLKFNYILERLPWLGFTNKL
jgi:hypothetical protein